MVWCTNGTSAFAFRPPSSPLAPGVTKPLISAKEFVALAKQHSNTSRRSYFTIFIYNNDAEDNDDWKDELELDYVRISSMNADLRCLPCAVQDQDCQPPSDHPQLQPPLSALRPVACVLCDPR